MSIEFEKTGRGFGKGIFIDRYGSKCSIQDSSLATEAAIWLGLEKIEVKTCRQGEGWKSHPIPEDAHIFSRMHLTIPMAKELRAALDRFIDTGAVAGDTIIIPTRACQNCDVHFEFKNDEKFCSAECQSIEE